MKKMTLTIFILLFGITSFSTATFAMDDPPIWENPIATTDDPPVWG